MKAKRKKNIQREHIGFFLDCLLLLSRPETKKTANVAKNCCHHHHLMMIKGKKQSLVFYQVFDYYYYDDFIFTQHSWVLGFFLFDYFYS